MLEHLQNPAVVHDVASGVASLRGWGRWHTRCFDCGMVAPDPSVLSNGLTKMTAQVLSHHPDPLLRTQMVRSALHVENHPTEVAVMESTNICWPSLRRWLERRLPKRVGQATLH